jgi:hypothetical protein
LRPNPGADLARRARQGRRDPLFQIDFLRGAKKEPTLPPMSKQVRLAIPHCSNNLRQPRLVSHPTLTQRRPRDWLHPASKSTKAFARRVTREAADPSRAGATSSLRSPSPRKPHRIMHPSESDRAQDARNFPVSPLKSRYNNTFFRFSVICFAGPSDLCR